MLDLSKLVDALTAETNALEAVKAFVLSVSATLADLPVTQQAINDYADQLKAKADEIALAVVTGTPAEPPVP